MSLSWPKFSAEYTLRTNFAGAKPPIKHEVSIKELQDKKSSLEMAENFLAYNNRQYCMETSLWLNFCIMQSSRMSITDHS